MEKDGILGDILASTDSLEDEYHFESEDETSPPPSSLSREKSKNSSNSGNNSEKNITEQKEDLKSNENNVKDTLNYADRKQTKEGERNRTNEQKSFNERLDEKQQRNSAPKSAQRSQRSPVHDDNRSKYTSQKQNYGNSYAPYPTKKEPVSRERYHSAYSNKTSSPRSSLSPSYPSSKSSASQSTVKDYNESSYKRDNRDYRDNRDNRDYKDYRDNRDTRVYRDKKDYIKNSNYNSNKDNKEKDYRDRDYKDRDIIHKKNDSRRNDKDYQSDTIIIDNRNKYIKDSQQKEERKEDTSRRVIKIKGAKNRDLRRERNDFQNEKFNQLFRMGGVHSIIRYAIDHKSNYDSNKSKEKMKIEKISKKVDYHFQFLFAKSICGYYVIKLSQDEYNHLHSYKTIDLHSSWNSSIGKSYEKYQLTFLFCIVNDELKGYLKILSFSTLHKIRLKWVVHRRFPNINLSNYLNEHQLVDGAEIDPTIGEKICDLISDLSK